jgi:lipopolysaccharide transport system permease protein
LTFLKKLGKTLLVLKSLEESENKPSLVKYWNLYSKRKNMSKFRLVIESGRLERNYWKDLWHYKELFAFIAWRDILVRYKQTVIGIAWSVIRPLLTMIVFTIIFGKVAKLPSDGVPYPILVFAAMLPWQFFSNTLSEGGNSLIINSNMITKVYFPRIIIPTTSMIVSLIDFIISFAIMCVLLIFYLYAPSWKIIFFPGFLGLAILTSLGITFGISALNVKYRDFRYVVPFIIQFGLYISPVGFSSSVIPEKWRLLYSLNPMVGVIDGFRWSITGDNSIIYWPGFFLSLGVAILLFIIGIKYFRTTEREFADVI